MRLPDDETDTVVHRWGAREDVSKQMLLDVSLRGGRFINNVFVPAGASVALPREVRVSGGVGGELSRRGRSVHSAPKGWWETKFLFEKIHEP